MTNNKLSLIEAEMLDAIANYTRQTKDTAEGVTGWGGSRPGAGRKPTGRSRRQIYLTNDEYIKVKKYVDQLRAAE